MSDTIFITGVVIHARHGVMEHETEVGQRFVIDLELSADLSEASHTDHLADTVSYASVVSTATAAFKNTNYKLLERAAGATLDPARSHLMLCGNPAMIEEMTTLLGARGLRKHRVRNPGHITIEKYW